MLLPIPNSFFEPSMVFSQTRSWAITIFDAWGRWHQLLCCLLLVAAFVHWRLKIVNCLRMAALVHGTCMVPLCRTCFCFSVCVGCGLVGCVGVDMGCWQCRRDVWVGGLGECSLICSGPCAIGATTCQRCMGLGVYRS